MQSNKFTRITFSFVLFSFFISSMTMAQCPGCVVDLPMGMAEDTLYLGSLEDGMVGVYYDGDLSFRMPKTTTPVNEIDPDIPEGLTINEIELVGLSNLPPGLSYEANQSVYDPSEETDGCLKICGTTFQPGLYIIEVTVEATIIVFTQTATFPVELYIAPSSSVNDGFSLTNTTGCGELTVSFENNVPSNGDLGFSYFWDFGNGFTTTDEQPQDQTYTEPGEYIINYEAVIDTVGYILTNVIITDLSCDDIPTSPDWSFNPDIKIQITDPNGNMIVDSETIWNQDPPYEFPLNVPLEEATYQVKAIDEDAGINGADDVCGEVPFNQLTSGPITIGDFSVELEIIHPVEVINSSDTVVVFEIPEMPVITSSLPVSLCYGETVIFSSSYDQGNQWYFNGEVLENETFTDLEVTESGAYSVVYTSPDGCTAESDLTEIIFLDNPVIPSYSNMNNLLTVDGNVEITSNIELQWYQNGVAIEGETGSFFCVGEDGEYTLEITDTDTGCTNEYTEFVEYDENVDCFNAINEFSENINLKIFPNPVIDKLNISLENYDNQAISVSIYSLLGQIHKHETLTPQGNGTIRRILDVSNLPSGLHLLEIRSGDQYVTKKFVKQ